MIAIILQILTVSLMGIVNALFGYFIDYCFWKGSIFGFWLPFLAKQICKVKYPETYDIAIKLKPEEGNAIMETECSTVFFYKIMGGCVICTNIWIGMFSWAAIVYFSGIFEWYYGIVYLMVSSAFLRKLVKATY